MKTIEERLSAIGWDGELDRHVTAGFALKLCREAARRGYEAGRHAGYNEACRDVGHEYDTNFDSQKEADVWM